MAVTPRSAGQPLAVVLMGVSGCGKSTLGRGLAMQLAVPFLEGDAYHPAANIAKMRAGMALTDDDRGPWLDSLGSALGEAARRSGLAVGACSALKRAYRDRLRAQAKAPVYFLCLQGGESALAARMMRRADHFMPASLLASQFATLELPDAGEDAAIFDATEAQDALLARINQAVAARWAAPSGV